MARARKRTRRVTRAKARHPVRSKARRPDRGPSPVAGPEAFRDMQRRDHVMSQAATLALIGAQLRGDPVATVSGPGPASRTMRAARAGAPAAVPASDLRQLGFPRLTAGAPRFRPEVLQRVAGVRFTSARAAVPSRTDQRIASASVSQAANAFYRDTSHETAAALLEVSLRHPQELVRVTAAASYVPVTTDPAPALSILERGAGSRDALTRDVAATALGRLDPRNPALAPLLEARRRRSRMRRSRTALLVHGTWARSSSWWQPPGGDFWSYYHAQVDPTLYGAADRFEWSGGYSDAARALGGNDLHTWVNDRALDGLDLIGHSHGASVVMLANHAGTHIGRMILLSCPVHWPKYTPNFMRVGRVISIRVHLDLVILIDGGGQRFNHPQIEEHVLPIWFDHSASHDPAIWQRFNVPAWL
jgi:hypothetical protein